MVQNTFHTSWLFIFNALLIALAPLIRGPGNYLAFTLIFLSTNILILSFIWQAIGNGKIEIVLSPLSAISFVFLGIILFSYLFTINPPSTRYGFFTMASVIINGAFLSFIIPPCPPLEKVGWGDFQAKGDENQPHPHLNPLPEGEETILPPPLKGDNLIPPPLQGEGWGGDGVKKIFSEQRLWQGLCFVLVLTVSALSIMALYQYITGQSNFEGRAHATFVNPNSFSGYLLLTMPVLMGLYLSSKKYTITFFLLNMLSFAAILATGTGGRWVLLAAAILVALAVFWMFTAENPPVSPFSKVGLAGFPPLTKGGKGGFVKKRLILLAIGFLSVLFIFFTPFASSKISLSPKPAELSGSTMDRLNIWKSTWDVIKEHPIRGVGFWGFHTIYSKYKNRIYKDIEHYFSHNDYLQLWAELGLIGVVVFLILIFIYFREGFRCLEAMSVANVGEGLVPSQRETTRISPTNRIMLLSTLIGSFLLLIHTISDFDLYIPSILFIFWGYIAYASSKAEEYGLCRTKVIDLKSYRGFTTLGTNKLYIITGGIFAFLSIWVADPYLAGLYNERGKAYLSRDEYEKAVKFFSKAVKLDSVDDSYHFNLGLALAKSSNDPLTLKRAEDEMKKAMAISPYRSDIYFNLANFYREFYLKEKGDTAIALMKKAIELDPSDITPMHNLGVLYLQLGRYEDAIVEFKKYLNEKPDDVEAHIEICGAYRMNREYDNAIQEIDFVITKNSKNNYAHFLKANILAEIGQYDEAYKEYQISLREKGKEGLIWNAIGELLLKQGKKREAEEAFKRGNAAPLDQRKGHG